METHDPVGAARFDAELVEVVAKAFRNGVSGSRAPVDAHVVEQAFLALLSQFLDALQQAQLDQCRMDGNEASRRFGLERLAIGIRGDSDARDAVFLDEV